MQSLSEALGGRKGGSWMRRRGPRRGGRGSGRRRGLRVLPLALTQAWAGAPARLGAWRGRAPASWALAGLFLAGTVVYGLSVGGYFAQVKAQFTDQLADRVSAMVARSGFTVQRLTVVGLHRAERDDIVEALALNPGQSMLSLDTAAAQARLERLAWVRQAQVMRLLPSALHVVIEERTPFVVWQLRGKFELVDSEGVVLGPLGQEDPSGLPLVVGEGAAAAAPALFRALTAHPDLRARLSAAVRVADRRWNLELADGLEVRLPEENLARALDRLAELDRPRKLPESDLVAVDLRLPDRITLRLTEDAATRWREQISEPRHAPDALARET